MDIKVELEEAKTNRQKIIDRVNLIGEEINRLSQERQGLLQEALRCDGEVRVLERISSDGTKGGAQ